MKGAHELDPLKIQFVALVVAVLILGWAIVVLSRRYFRERALASKQLNGWMKLDSTLDDDNEEQLPVQESDEEEERVPESDVRIKAQQNGHHTESKKLL